MKIHDDVEKSGHWLFKHRSYFPLLIIPILLFALKDSEYFERHFGHAIQTPWEVFCVTASFLGLLIRVLTVAHVPEGTSGRNTKGQLADSLNTEGMYSILRHPLYLGNFFIVLGFALFIQVWWFVIIFMLSFCIFYERIIFSEESFLERKFGAPYRKWAGETPLFFPNLKHWKKPERHFSWKMVLKREYSTFFGIIVGFVLIKFFADLVGEHEFKVRIVLLVFLGGGALVYFILRRIRKKTKWLHIKKAS